MSPNKTSLNVEDLIIYKKSLLLVKSIYNLMGVHSLFNRDYSLCDQIKRSSVFVTANISEGFLRSRKLSQHFYHIAVGSANEVITLLTVVELVHGISTKQLIEDYRYLAKQINLFSKSF